MFFFILVQIFATSQLWSGSVSAAGFHTTAESPFYKYIVQLSQFQSSGAFQKYHLFFGFLNLVLVIASPFLSKKWMSSSSINH